MEGRKLGEKKKRTNGYREGPAGEKRVKEKSSS